MTRQAERAQVNYVLFCSTALRYNLKCCCSKASEEKRCVNFFLSIIQDEGYIPQIATDQYRRHHGFWQFFKATKRGFVLILCYRNSRKYAVV